MRSNERISKEVAVLIMLGGPSAWFIGLLVNSYIPLLNYREMRPGGWLWLILFAMLVLYACGIYLVALVIQLTSRQTKEIEPAFLALGGTVGLLTIPISMYSLKSIIHGEGMVLLAVLIVIPIQNEVEQNKRYC